MTALIVHKRLSNIQQFSETLVIAYGILNYNINTKHARNNIVYTHYPLFIFLGVLRFISIDEVV